MAYRKYVVIVALAAGLCCGAGVTPRGALAQDASQQLPTVVMAVVDIQKIMRESAASVSIRDQIDQIRAGYQSELDAKEERLRGTDEELKRQRAILAPEAFEEKRKEFEEQVLEVQRDVQGRNAVIEQAVGNATSKIREKLIPILAKIMEQRGASILMDKSQVLVSDKTLEVTTTALNRLNKALPEVTVEIPEPE
jgi:Skp family chaperone for outer membrane proteins